MQRMRQSRKKKKTTSKADCVIITFSTHPECYLKIEVKIICSTLLFQPEYGLSVENFESYVQTLIVLKK